MILHLCMFCRSTAPVRSNIVSSHLAGPGSIPGGVSFSDWGFLRGFSSSVRQMSGKLRPHLSPDIIGYHNHHKSFHTGANDLLCWRTFKKKHTHTHTYYRPYYPLQVVLVQCHESNMPFSQQYYSLDKEPFEKWIAHIWYTLSRRPVWSSTS